MSIQFNDGQSYADWGDYYGQKIIPNEGKNSYHQEISSLEQESNQSEQDTMSRREDMHSGFDAHHPKENQNIDREHHVPLVASAIMGENGEMTGLAIDHRIQVPPEYIGHLAKHEAAELPHMQNLIDAGMKPHEAYYEAHDRIATPVESASVRAHAVRSGLDPDQYHDQYKQFFRDAAAIAKEPSDRERHPDAHTTRYALDEHELGYKGPLQIDVLGQGMAMHSGPGPIKRPSENVGREKPANENIPAEENPVVLTADQFKYYQALFKQQDKRLEHSKGDDDPWVIMPKDQPGLKVPIIYPKKEDRAQNIFEQNARMGTEPKEDK